MSIIVGQTSKTLSSGRKWYAYSGVVQGGGAIPAFVTLIEIPSTGLNDSYVKITPFYGQPSSTGVASALGIKVLIDDIEIYSSQPNDDARAGGAIELFIPQQSKLEIQSINTAANTLQDRGVAVLGWYA